MESADVAVGVVSRYRRPETGSVVFFDGGGRRWQVTEASGATVPAARGPSCLIFASSEAVRRVWDYPDDWRELSAEELLAVSWRR
jgi:hypothetical protein